MTSRNEGGLNLSFAQRTSGAIASLFAASLLFGCGKVTVDSNAASGSKDFALVGEMGIPRSEHKSILLDDGKVLIWGGGKSASWEVFDPANKKFSAVQSGAPSVSVQPDGQVVLAGKYKIGLHSNNPDLADLLVAKEKLIVPRDLYTAIILKSGKILVAGGRVNDKSDYVNSAELYDPVAQKSTSTGSMKKIRLDEGAVLLNDGKVLFIGGLIGAKPPWTMSSTSEMYDPATGKFEDGPELHGPRHNFKTAKLDDGRVLVIGGFTSGNSASILRGVEMYDPNEHEFKPAGELNIGLVGNSATVMPNHRVMIAGGMYNNKQDGTFNYTRDVEIFDPVSLKFTTEETMNSRRAYHNAILTRDGHVLITGGKGQEDKTPDTPNVRSCRAEQSTAEESR